MTEVLRDMYEDFVARSDPRVRHWRMMDSPGPTMAIILVYLLSVLVFLPTYMKNRKPFDITNIIRYYNIFQILSCVAIIYMMATAGWITGEYSLGCQPIDYSDNPNAVRLVTAFYWLYLLKITELVETVFFVLRKKFSQVSGLHIYHHASTLFFAYIGCKFLGGGMASVPAMINCFIHILMYTYYYFSSFGPKWQKILAPWKSKLTMFQMIQFTFMLIHSLSALKPSCTVPKEFVFLYIPNVALIFKMFYDFYNASYSTKKQ